MGERALVTGGTGFVGVHLVRTLVDQGYEVVALDVEEPDAAFPPEASFVRGDVCRRSDVASAARGCGVIVANAALVPLTQSSPEEFLRVNRGGTETTLEVARGADAYVAHVSSSAIFGQPESNPVLPEAAMRPFEPYGESKARAEDVVHSYREKGLKVASLRPRTLVGPGRLGIFEIVFSRIRSGKRVPLFGSGSNRVQLADVGDYVRAVAAAIERRAVGDFNIGAETFGTVRADIEELIRRVHSPSKIVPIPVPLLKAALVPLGAVGLSPLSKWHWVHASEDFYFDTTLAQEQLGWTPLRSNADALEAAFHEYEVAPPRGGGSAHRRPMPGFVAKLLRS